MTIPSKQIGWSEKSKLLWQICKQLEKLIQIVGSNNAPIYTTTTTTTSSLETFLITESGYVLTTEDNKFLII